MEGDFHAGSLGKDRELFIGSRASVRGVRRHGIPAVVVADASPGEFAGCWIELAHAGFVVAHPTEPART